MAGLRDKNVVLTSQHQLIQEVKLSQLNKMLIEQDANSHVATEI